MGKTLGGIGWIVGAGVGYAVGKYYPGILLQLVVAYLLYWVGKKIVLKIAIPDVSKNDTRKKWIYALSVLGLLGLISPVLGYIFALPSFLLATELITTDYKNRKRAIYISTAVVVVCLVNAAIGAIIFSMK